MSQVKSRDQFVKQVADVLKDSKRDGEAFVFGISGRWGEGKTTFLKSLKNELKPYPVISVNPWKYAKDDNSFMRAFLQTLAREADKTLWHRFVSRLKQDWEFIRSSVKYDNQTVYSKYKIRASKRRAFKTKDLEPLYFDSSRYRINLRPLVVVLLILCAAILAYKFGLNDSHRQAIRDSKTALTLLLIPVVMGVMQSLTTTQRANKALSTQDSFEQILNDILEAIPYETVVVFVDDLDRLTAKRAIGVLDNLRTFFDNPKLVFVVAGDHTVLEGHLGRELKPGETHDEQAEEGRRFLKKIFNVYWRLPLPTKPEFGEYVDGLIGKETNSFVHDWLKNAEQRKIFKQQLLQYFANNYRNTQRFVDRVAFTFRVIDGQINNEKLTDEGKSYFREMQQSPLLVIRILLFEELANPLYERIVARPELLIKLELAATLRDGGARIDNLLTENDKQFLTYSQRQFVKSFLYQKPRFRDEGGERVKSLQAYIALSSDTSFGDSRGYTPDEFLHHVQAEHYPDLREVLERSGEVKLVEAANSIVPAMEKYTDALPRYDILLKYVRTISVLDAELPAFKILTTKLMEIDFTLLETIEQQKRIEFVIELDNAFQDKLSKELVGVLTAKVKLKDEDLNHLSSLPESCGEVASEAFLRCYEEYAAVNPNSALDLTVPYKSKFHAPVLKRIVERNKARLISEFISDNNDARRSMRLELLSMNESAKSELEQVVHEQIVQKNPYVWAWVVSNARTDNPLLTESRITRALCDSLRSDSSYQEVKSTLNLAINWPSSATELWDTIMSRDEEDVLLLIADVYNQSNYSPIAPNANQANELVKLIIKRHVSQDGFDESSAVGWLDRVNRTYWPFSKLGQLNGRLKHTISSKSRANYLPQPVKDRLANLLNGVF